MPFAVFARERSDLVFIMIKKFGITASR